MGENSVMAAASRVKATETVKVEVEPVPMAEEECCKKTQEAEGTKCCKSKADM